MSHTSTGATRRGPLFIARALVALTVGVGAFVLTATMASATGVTPTLTGAANFSNTTATLYGALNPGGVSTTIAFCYSTSAITITGGNCTVSSGSISYASADQSPSTSSSAITATATLSGLGAATKYYYAIGASQSVGTTNWSVAKNFTTISGAAFVCTPNLYQVNNDYTWEFSPATNSFVKLNSVAQTTGLNAMGYDAANNYLYAMGSSGGDLFQIGTDGAENNLGTPSSPPQTTGADFIPNTNFLVTASNTGSFDLTDVASPTLTTVALGSTGSTFAAADITWTENSSNTDYVGYGLKGTGANAATLYIVTLPVTDIPSSSANWGSIPANPLAVTVDTGISLSGGTATASDSYGAAYSDSTGDAFFYDNTQEELFEATSAQIAALGNQTFTFRASSASTSGFSTGGNDGASCPNATSPFAAPTPINDSYTIATNTSLSVTNASTSVFNNDQVVSGTSYNVDNVVLEPGANQVTQNFTSSSSSGALVGANGTLDVTNANLGYFTFTPNSGFTGTESFTYNIDETSPNNGVSNTTATVSINVVHQQVVSWAIGNDLSTSVASTAPSPATDLGGAPLTYLVNVSDANTADCSVNVTTGVITYFSAGVCTVDVSAAATSSYTAGFAELTFDVTSLTVPTLSWSPSPSSTPVSPSGTTITPAPTTNSAGAITYAIASSNNTAGCTLASASAPIVLMSTAQGVCSITATVAANGSYSAETITSPFAILATPTLTWAPTPTSFTTVQSPQTIVGVTTNSDGAITYVIDGTGDTAGCTLSSSGAPVMLHFATAGGCTVDAAVGASTTYAAAAISQTFSVTVAPPSTITQSAPFANASSDTAGQVFSDQLVTTGQSGAVSFSAGGTLPPGVAVSSSGHIVCNGTTPAGVFTLHGTDSDTSSESGTWTYTFTVTALTVRGGPITEGNSLASVIAGTPFSGTIVTSGNDGAVTFTTLTGSAFTVNSSGAISAPPTLIPGMYSVTGTDTDGHGHTGVWSFTLTVVASPSTISVTLPNPGAIGQTYTPVVVTSGPAVTVTTSTPSICSVRNAVVTYLASGTCTLTFATIASVDYDATTVTQHITVRVPRKVHLTLFNFANDEWTLTPSMLNRLNRLAGTITRDGDTHISISGYASSTGGAAHNVLLSRQRAVIVTKRLLENLKKDGATVALLRSLGHGAVNFVSSNTAAAANRRVSVSAW